MGKRANNITKKQSKRSKKTTPTKVRAQKLTKGQTKRECLRCEEVFVRQYTGQFLCIACREYNAAQSEDDYTIIK